MNGSESHVSQNKACGSCSRVRRYIQYRSDTRLEQTEDRNGSVWQKDLEG